MTAFRTLPLASCLSAVLLCLVAPLAAEDGPVILDGGRSWAVQDSATMEGALVPLPIPVGNILLHRAVGTSQGYLATGIEREDRDGRAIEKLLILRVDGDKMERLPAPKQMHDAVTYSPTQVVSDGKLSNLVWIEGFAADRTRVMASEWTGTSWSQAEPVSDFGAGTQIALDLTRLGDGSLLAVWAAFDGEDDEIVWSRSRTNGSWSNPRPLTANAVPDVTPTLHATETGAVVAWSGYDGKDYRIQLSRLALGTSGNPEGWSAPVLLEGRGGVWPEFHTEGQTAILTWRQAVPRTWMATVMDGETLLWTSPAAQPPAQLRGRPMAEMAQAELRLYWPIASADGVAKTEHGELTILAQTVVRPPAN